jgi:hypothetical protein
MLHHLMIGTWTPPGAIFSVEFDDEKLTLKLIKKTTIPHDEPISWITFDASEISSLHVTQNLTISLAYKEKYLWSVNEEMV